MNFPRHEIPTHLGVEDRAFYGLSVRQVMYLTSGFSLGYGLWNQWSDVPIELRLALALTCAVVAIALAMVRPYGRGFEDWAFVVLRYLLIPRHCVWSPSERDSERRRGSAEGWIDLKPNHRWEENTRCPA